MLAFAENLLPFVFYANMALFALLYMFVILPRLGDLQVKIEYSIFDVITAQYLGKQFTAYRRTLSPDDHRRWHNRYMLHFAAPLQVGLFVLMILLMLVGDT
jgi:hypothetical protein